MRRRPQKGGSVESLKRKEQNKPGGLDGSGSRANPRHKKTGQPWVVLQSKRNRCSGQDGGEGRRKEGKKQIHESVQNDDQSGQACIVGNENEKKRHEVSKNEKGSLGKKMTQTTREREPNVRPQMNTNLQGKSSAARLTGGKEEEAPTIRL